MLQVSLPSFRVKVWVWPTCFKPRNVLIKTMAEGWGMPTSTVLPLAACRMSPGRIPRPSIMFSHAAVMMCTCSLQCMQPFITLLCSIPAALVSLLPLEGRLITAPKGKRNPRCVRHLVNSRTTQETGSYNPGRTVMEFSGWCLSTANVCEPQIHMPQIHQH